MVRFRAGVPLASPAADPPAIVEPPRIYTIEIRERADQNEECQKDERRHANLTSSRIVSSNENARSVISIPPPMPRDVLSGSP